MTDYVVLHYIDHDDHWTRVNEGDADPHVIQARSAQAAIAQWLNGETLGGTYVAVPTRSWRPVTVKVETKTALRFS